MNLSRVTRNIGKGLAKRSPEILVGLGIAGFFTAGIMAVTSTPKALDIMAEIKEEHKNELDDKQIMGKEIVTKVAPVYIPAVAVAGLATACVIGSNRISARRTAALATAYSLSESALERLNNKLLETEGPKKTQQIKDSISQDRVNENPVNNKEVIITNTGECLFMDSVSGRYFNSSIEKIKSVVNELNRDMISDQYVSLNQFYFDIGLNSTALGDSLGWNLDRGFIDISFSAVVAEDGRPCIVLDYIVQPEYDYDIFG